MPVRQHFPVNRLASALASARPRPVELSLREANRRLHQLSGDCASHVDRELRALDALVESWPPLFDDGVLVAVYRHAIGIVGSAAIAGLGHLDRAAQSLCDVVDGLFSSQQWDREPIDVHVRAMQMLRTTKKKEEADALIGGLQKVRAKYAAEDSSALT